MAQYVLNASNFKPNQVGGLYHIGLSDGSSSFGYVFQSGSHGIKEESNVTDKDKLIQYSSPNLIDRDLVFYPRVTQGDFSGGGLQLVALDHTKFFDADLEVRTPGYLMLRPGWVRTQVVTGTGTYQCVTAIGSTWTCNGTNNIYKPDGTSVNVGINVKFLDTDGNVLIMGDGVNRVRIYDGSGQSDISVTMGAFQQMWYINQATNGRFLYFTPDGHGISKLDFNTTSIAAVPTGNNFFKVLDIEPYQTGIAILTTDLNNSGNSDVWFHDGQNMTRIIHIPQYVAVGMASVLGSLYVTAQSYGQFEPPVLFRIDSGNITVAVRAGSPLIGANNAQIGAPEASGQYVYFALVNPQINNVTTTHYIGSYDHVLDAFSHLPALDANDNPQVSQVRQMAVNGRAVVFPMSSGGNTHVQYQTNSSNLPAGGSTYRTSGTMVTSRLDFGTPGIPKRFRRVEVVHSPLATGESITVKAYVDQDPLAFTPSLAPVPPTATTVNSTLGSTLTSLTFGVDTVGRTVYIALILGGNGSTTPKVNREAVEIGGTWTWTFDLDCTARRRLLNQATEDSQGTSGKDLYYLLRNAYENGTLLTLYLASGISYSVTIESLQAQNPGYVDHMQTPVRADEEWLVHAVLKQVA